jgi:tetratricopeptide (TPR) repeat protein
MGAVYITQQNYNDAIKVIRTAMTKDRAFADAYYNLGLAYLGLYAQSNYTDTGKRDQAEMLLKRATELNPKLVDVHTTLAQLYLDKGDTEKALIRQRLAVELDPGNITSWKKMGEIYERAGDTEKAKLSFDRAKELKEAPQKMAASQAEAQATAEFQAGTQLMDKGEKALQAKSTETAKKYFAEAVPHLQAATKANPKMWDAYYNWGLALFQSGNSDGALKVWKDLLQQNPNYVRATYNIGMVNWRSGKIAEAKPYLCRFISAGGSEFANEVKSLQAEMAKNNVVCP